MDASSVKTEKAIRWDTSENRIFFDIQQRTMNGMLVLARSVDGRIDMRFIKGNMSDPASSIDFNKSLNIS